MDCIIAIRIILLVATVIISTLLPPYVASCFVLAKHCNINIGLQHYRSHGLHQAMLRTLVTVHMVYIHSTRFSALPWLKMNGLQLKDTELAPHLSNFHNGTTRFPNHKVALTVHHVDVREYSWFLSVWISSPSGPAEHTKTKPSFKCVSCISYNLQRPSDAERFCRSCWPYNSHECVWLWGILGMEMG